MQRKTTLFTLFALTLLILAALSFSGVWRSVVPAASAQGNSLQHRALTLADITGKYAYQATGTFPQGGPGIPVGAPFAANALLTIGADGSYTTTGWQSLNGVAISLTSNGTITAVNADGTGRAQDTGGVVLYYFVVAEGGKTLKILAITQGTVIAGTATRL